MSVLSEFSNQQAVADAGGLTELELAVLTIGNQQLEPDDEALWAQTVEKVKGLLAVSVGGRKKTGCTEEGCCLPAVYAFLKGGKKARACQGHLAGMLTEDTEVAVVGEVASAEPVEMAEEPEPPAEAK